MLCDHFFFEIQMQTKSAYARLPRLGKTMAEYVRTSTNTCFQPKHHSQELETTTDTGSISIL